MLQGFYYESYRFGDTDKFPALGTQLRYQIVLAKAPDIAGANFGLVWLPPATRTIASTRPATDGGCG